MGYRIEKVAEEIKHKMNTAMSRDIMDMSVGLLTVSRVIMSPDLKNSKIYFTLIGNKEPGDKIAEKLNFRKKHIRFLLGKQLTLKYIPDIHFYYDDTPEVADRIDKILKEIHKDDKPENDSEQ